MRTSRFVAIIGFFLLPGGLASAQVRTDAGVVQGTATSTSGVRAFKGIPFAAPPVGDLRWKAPQPVTSWEGVRKADAFGARCMQGRIFADMIFRDEMSEDCLYLNVWTPARSERDRLPVMVWIYGGGFQAGSASEPRQDGEHLASKGVVLVNFNYRLGVFGFLSHPELTKESDRDASGNYGLMDMIAALQWVKRNIAEFGGDPGNITIFGESAGSFAVSALMASPEAKGLFHRAIGESGAFFTAGGQTLAAQSLASTDAAGQKFATSLGADSLAALRAKAADAVLDAALHAPMLGFRPNIDGYVLPKDVYSIYAAHEQAPVPLLAGWNADEVRGGVVLANPRPTAQSFTDRIRKDFGADADAVLKAYPATSDAEALESAAALASDNFIGYCTWKWIEMQAALARTAVYRFSFDRKIPVAPDTKMSGVPATSADIGARHAGEIEYVFGTLDSVPNVTWQPDDRKLSDEMMTYWTNFARSGDPNGPPSRSSRGTGAKDGGGLAKWPRYESSTGRQVIHLDTTIKAGPDPREARYELLDARMAKLRSQS
jgi:para-nitrobenzyl esterase